MTVQTREVQSTILLPPGCINAHALCWWVGNDSKRETRRRWLGAISILWGGGWGHQEQHKVHLACRFLPPGTTIMNMGVTLARKGGHCRTAALRLGTATRGAGLAETTNSAGHKQGMPHRHEAHNLRVDLDVVNACVSGG